MLYVMYSISIDNTCYSTALPSEAGAQENGSSNRERRSEWKAAAGQERDDDDDFNVKKGKGAYSC